MPDNLSPVFAALGDPTRRHILARLAEGERTVGDLAQPFDMSLPAVSKHLTVLENAGLISRLKVGRERRCRLEPAALEAAGDWIGFFEQFWDAKLAALARAVEDGPR